MGHYHTGDVLLAPIQIRHGGVEKVRPVLVIGHGESGTLLACPISSRAPRDMPCVSLSLDDFTEGGLDLFHESYILTAFHCTVHPANVIGKKGRLSPGAVSLLTGAVPGRRTKHRSRSDNQNG